MRMSLFRMVVARAPQEGAPRCFQRQASSNPIQHERFRASLSVRPSSHSWRARLSHRGVPMDAHTLTAQQQLMIDLFERHVAAELAGDLDTTMNTMTENPHLLNVPSGIGGAGRDGV